MNPIYKERTFSGLLVILPGLFGAAMLGIFIYTRVSGSFVDPTSPWFFLGIGIFLLLIAINFTFLTIEISSQGITSRFGIISHFTPADNIAGTYEDKTSSVSYGGFGIRFGWVNGKRRTVYNVTNAPRVVVAQRRDPSREFVFSTRNPGAVIKAIQEIAGQ